VTKKTKRLTVVVEVSEDDDFIGRVTMEYRSRTMMARVFRELAEKLASDEPLTGSELRGLLKVIN